MCITSYRPLLFVLGFGLLAAGCMPLGFPTRSSDSRYPDSRRAPSRTEAAVYARVSNDADRYVRGLDRALRLDRRQERRLHDLLTDRAYDRVRRTHARDRNRAYPFPRRAGDRYNRSWWRSTDRQIERVLDRRQKRVHRDLVRGRDDRGHGNRGRGNRGRGHLPGRGD